MPKTNQLNTKNISTSVQPILDCQKIPPRKRISELLHLFSFVLLTILGPRKRHAKSPRLRESKWVVLWRSTFFRLNSVQTDITRHEIIMHSILPRPQSSNSVKFLSVCSVQLADLWLHTHVAKWVSQQ